MDVSAPIQPTSQSGQNNRLTPSRQRPAPACVPGDRAHLVILASVENDIQIDGPRPEAEAVKVASQMRLPQMRVTEASDLDYIAITIKNLHIFQYHERICRYKSRWGTVTRF